MKDTNASMKAAKQKENFYYSRQIDRYTEEEE